MLVLRVQEFFQRRFRPARIAALRADCPEIDDPNARILDVGGRAGWWNMVGPRATDITIVNILDNCREDVEKAGYRFAVADGCDLPYADNEFDLVLSNSVIEHVGTWENQQRFAAEAMRCGRNVYLQTPYKFFPVEPHLVAPFIHWLPRAAKARLIRHFSVWGWSRKPSKAQIEAWLDEVRLLTVSELQQILPGAQVKREKFLGLTKSLMMVFRDTSDRVIDLRATESQALPTTPKG